MINAEDDITFNELTWDTNFFGVTSAKATLNKPLKYNEWNKLKTRFESYQFISILNYNSEPQNARIIGEETTAFLADINIQFEKKLTSKSEMQDNVMIHQALKKSDEIIEIADFPISKFTEDPELAKRNGNQVYRQWLLNSFEKKDKFFAISVNENGAINGFLLYSYSSNACVIELIGVSKKDKQGGIGTSLFNSVEHAAYEQGCNKVKVGTQLRNISAINFYNRIGCKQVKSHQTYHLWKL